MNKLYTNLTSKQKSYFLILLILFVAIILYFAFQSSTYRYSAEETPICGISGEVCKLNLSTEKSSYKEGETIQVKLINSLSSPITFSDDMIWSVFNSENILVYHPNKNQEQTVLNPGVEKIWLWNQNDLSGRPVLPGQYTIKITKPQYSGFNDSEIFITQ